MSLYSILSFIGALFCLGLVVLVLIRDRRSFVPWAFAPGMIVLALEAVIIGFGLEAFLPDDVIYWQRARLSFTAFIPGIWLLFALTYARVNYKEIISRWRWVVLATFIIPLSFATFFRKSFFAGEPVLDSPSTWIIPLGGSGYFFHICLLVGAVLILMNLERTLR